MLVAGDVYDRAVPPLAAVELFDDALHRLADLGVPDRDDLRQPRLGPPARRRRRADRAAPASTCAPTPPAAPPPSCSRDAHGDGRLLRAALPRTRPGPGRVRAPSGPATKAVLGAAMDRVRADLADAGRPAPGPSCSPTPSSPAAQASDSERDITVGGVAAVPAGRLRRRRLRRPRPSARLPDHHRAGPLLRLAARVLLLRGATTARPCGWSTSAARRRDRRRARRLPGAAPARPAPRHAWRTCSPTRARPRTRTPGSRRPSPTRSARHDRWPGSPSASRTPSASSSTPSGRRTTRRVVRAAPARAATTSRSPRTSSPMSAAARPDAARDAPCCATPFDAVRVGRRTVRGGGPVRLHRLDLTAFGPFGGHPGASTSTSCPPPGSSCCTAPPAPARPPSWTPSATRCTARCPAPGRARAPAAQRPRRARHPHRGRPRTHRRRTAAGDHPAARAAAPQEARHRHHHGQGADAGCASTTPRRARWQDLSRSHQEIGEEISQLLGMSREQFCQVVLLPQGDFARFLRADAEARGKLLGRLFDTRRFAAVEQRLAERAQGAAGSGARPGTTRLLGRSPTACSRPRATAWTTAPRRRAGRPGPGRRRVPGPRAAVARSAARERRDARPSPGVAGRVRRAGEPRADGARRTPHATPPAARARLARHGTRNAAAAPAARGRARARTSRASGREARMRTRPARPSRSRPAVALRESRRRAERRARARPEPDAARQLPAAARRTRRRERLAGAASARPAEELGGAGRRPPGRAALRRASPASGPTLERRGAGRRGGPAGRRRAGWPAGTRARAALQDRVDAAQEAAARAEQLAGPARARPAAG